MFSGLITCGACGGGYTLVGKIHYGCANARNRGICTNRLTIRRDVLEATVLEDLRKNLLHPELVRELVEAYRREVESGRRLERAGEAAKRKELGTVERQVRRIIEAVKDGFAVPSMREELIVLEKRKAALTADLESISAAPEPPALHPGLAQVYRKKVAELTEALNTEDMRTEAAEAIRALLEEIRMVPEKGELSVELVGALPGLPRPRDVVWTLPDEDHDRPLAADQARLFTRASEGCQPVAGVGARGCCAFRAFAPHALYACYAGQSRSPY